MPETDAASSILPIHIEETIQSVAGLNAEHHANATHHQRAVDRITSLLGRASFIATLTAFVVGWVSLNCFALALGYRAPRPASLCMVGGRIVVSVPLFGHPDLTTQRRRSPYPAPRAAQSGTDDLSEQKIAKVVALLEELRHDSPHLHDRVDEMADEMAQPADPQSVIDAIKEARSSAHVSRKADGV